jgi:hypothetical protein
MGQSREQIQDDRDDYREMRKDTKAERTNPRATAYDKRLYGRRLAETRTQLRKDVRSRGAKIAGRSVARTAARVATRSATSRSTR